jgi:hypothetical protein
LANGYLAYEDGTPSTGCTSPAWALVLAVLHAVFGHAARPDTLIASVILVGAALHLGGVLAAASLARRLSGSHGVAAAAGCLVALAAPLVAASLSGMEVALTSLLLLLGVRAVVTGSFGAAGLFLAGAGLARPECGASIVVLAAAASLLAPPARRRSAAARVLAAPVLAGLALVAYDLWASGAPLPATFYAKGALSMAALPHRLGTALGRMLSTVPPFGFAVGWVAAAGLLAGVAPRRRGAASAPSIAPANGLAPWIPFAAGAAFLLANLAVLDPIDPAAFYHLRYVLPPVPLFLVAAALGAHAWGRTPRAKGVALAALLVVAVAQAAVSVGPESRHLHNDVRNINEVQRAIGERLATTLPPGTRIAASDAGAVRYFSRLPTLDVIGMNTAGMRSPSDEFLRSHPVAAFAFLPAWFRTPDGARLEEMFEASTSGYTVTSNPAMATQVVVRARPDVGPGPVRARFGGFRSFALDFVVPEGAGLLSGRAGP